MNYNGLYIIVYWLYIPVNNILFRYWALSRIQLVPKNLVLFEKKGKYSRFVTGFGCWMPLKTDTHTHTHPNSRTHEQEIPLATRNLKPKIVS